MSKHDLFAMSYSKYCNLGPHDFDSIKITLFIVLSMWVFLEPNMKLIVLND